VVMYLRSARSGLVGGGRGPRILGPLDPARGLDENPMTARGGGSSTGAPGNDCCPNVRRRGKEASFVLDISSMGTL